MNLVAGRIVSVREDVKTAVPRKDVYSNTIMGNFTDGLRNIAPLDTLTLLHTIKPRCSVI